LIVEKNYIFEPKMNQEQKECLSFCLRLVDEQPSDFRVLRQALQGAVYLCRLNEQSYALTAEKLLKVVATPQQYRSNPRRYAVRAIGSLACLPRPSQNNSQIPIVDSQQPNAPSYSNAHANVNINAIASSCSLDADDQLQRDGVVIPAMKLLQQMVQKRAEGSQYVRKAAVTALSRIGRRYPSLQSHSIRELMRTSGSNASLPEVVRCAAIVGLGRLAQSDAELRCECAPALFERARNGKAYMIRAAAMQAIGQACCPVGDVANDPLLEERCFALACAFLQDGGAERHVLADPAAWNSGELYMTQRAAMRALGLLVRSSPDKWWPRVLPLVGRTLLEHRCHALVKSAALAALGQLGYYMARANVHFEHVQRIVYMFADKSANDMLASSAAHALVKFALAHAGDSLRAAGAIVRRKLFARGSRLDDVPEVDLQHYLRTYAMLVCGVYTPTLRYCSSVVAVSAEGQVSLSFASSSSSPLSTPVRSVPTTLSSSLAIRNVQHAIEDDPAVVACVLFADVDDAKRLPYARLRGAAVFAIVKSAQPTIAGASFVAAVANLVDLTLAASTLNTQLPTSIRFALHSETSLRSEIVALAHELGRISPRRCVYVDELEALFTR
jgi:hypothetical protein